MIVLQETSAHIIDG